MTPGARGELSERCLQIPGRRRSGQQRTYDRKALAPLAAQAFLYRALHYAGKFRDVSRCCLTGAGPIC